MPRATRTLRISRLRRMHFVRTAFGKGGAFLHGLFGRSRGHLTTAAHVKHSSIREMNLDVRIFHACSRGRLECARYLMADERFAVYLPSLHLLALNALFVH